MKTLLFLLTMISGATFAQTNVIAAKSHASTKAIDKNDTDNFGEPGPMRFIKEVTYYKNDCIIEKYDVKWDNHDTEYDTVCDHPFLQEGAIDIDRIKAMYPEGTVFNRFDKVGENTKQTKQELREMRKKKRSEKSNILLFFIIGGVMFLMYLFVPKLNLKRS